jgi:hypothetical protein
MSANASKPAAPVGRGGLGTDGLTKREYIAAAVIQGICASGPTFPDELLAREAVRLTDRLLAELEAK